MDLLRLRTAVSVAVTLLALAAPAQGTTLQRMGLEALTTTNRVAVLAEVVDSYSYWNREGTFILTDVRLEVLEVLKGEIETPKELELTLMGGTVGELTALIVAGAELMPENSYVLFLDEEDLPGADGVLTVRDHSQAAFEVKVSKGGELRAISQASDHPLVPDASGSTLAPGGRDGLPLDTMVRDIRAISAQSPSQPGR